MTFSWEHKIVMAACGSSGFADPKRSEVDDTTRRVHEWQRDVTNGCNTGGRLDLAVWP